MKLLLFFLLFWILSCFSANGQNLTVEQTLNYINQQLNEKNNKFSAVVYGHNNLGDYMDDYSSTVKIEHGVLIIVRTFSKHYTYQPKNFNESYENRIYIPAIEELSIPINEINNDYDYTSGGQTFCYNKPAELYIPQKNIKNFSVRKIIKSFNYEGKEVHKKTEKEPFFVIQFSNDNLICDKLRNAFTHLINLASKDSIYNTLDLVADSDPFANPIKKDTLNSNPITTINSNSIPMTKIGGVYEIPIIINGVMKLNFIFDAGATDVSISPDVALTLIRTGTVTDKDFLGTETYKFADGSIAKSKVLIIKEIQLGNKKVNNIKASISKSINAPLLLGQSVLNKFGKITIDYNRGVIVFQD